MHCVVPCCKSGYKSCREKRSIFSFPKNKKLRAKWLRAIPKKEGSKRPAVGSPYCGVCQLHFRARDILGTGLRPLLSKSAVPEIFPQQTPNVKRAATNTQLMVAVWDKNLATATELLKNGAQVNKPDANNDKPLSVATYNNDVIMVKMLLEKGANIEDPDGEGVTPLMQAVINGNEEIVHMLLDYGAEARTCNGKQETALMQACVKGRKEIAHALIKNGAQLDHANEEGFTPLMLAVKEGHLLLATLLLGCGANPNTTSRAGESPLLLALEGGHLTIAELLLAHGTHPVPPSNSSLSRIRDADRKRHLVLRQVLGEAHSENDHQVQTDLSICIKREKKEIMVPLVVNRRNDMGPIQKSRGLFRRHHFNRVTPEFRKWPRGTPLDRKTKLVVMNVIHRIMKSNACLSKADASAVASEITGVSLTSLEQDPNPPS